MKRFFQIRVKNWLKVKFVEDLNVEFQIKCNGKWLNYFIIYQSGALSTIFKKEYCLESRLFWDKS